MTYVLEDIDSREHRYALSYQELREHYYRFCSMTNKEFEKNIKEATHLACIICFIKEIPTYVCLSDTGLIHEMVHYMCFGEDNVDTTPLKQIRKMFKKILKLD